MGMFDRSLWNEALSIEVLFHFLARERAEVRVGILDHVAITIVYVAGTVHACQVSLVVIIAIALAPYPTDIPQAISTSD
jgi:hypothetical protein